MAEHERPPVGEDERPGEGACQWAILPAKVRYDSSLPANAKLIYAEIAAKCNQYGYCFCSNSWFAERFKLSADSASRLVKRLEDAGYISLDLDTARHNGDKRRIYLTAKPYDFIGGIGKNADTGKNAETVSAKMPRPLENNNNKTIPPKSPKGERARREPKTAADWKPERFDRLWRYYPSGKAKQRAIEAWDKLRPSDEDIAQMGRALKDQMSSEEWRRGVGIPYLATYLNQRRWEDEERTLPKEAAPAERADYVKGVAVWS